MTSNNVNFICLLVENSYFGEVTKMIKNEFFDYIDIPYCTEQGLLHGFETEPHITLWYGDGLNNGINWFDWFMEIKNRDLMKAVKSINCKDCLIDTFDNPESRVLKINVSGSKEYEILYKLNKAIEGVSTIPSEKEYNPHITLTYLKTDTPDEVLEQIKSKIVLTNLRNFSVTGLKIANSDREKIFNL